MPKRGFLKDLATSAARPRLLDAALSTIRQKGYAATTVDDICTAARLTKGSFFHYFKSKEDLAVAAADHFNAYADRVFDAAPFRTLPDPLDRVLGYLDFRAAILQGRIADYTCLLGTMVQETYDSHPAIREACDRHITAHAEGVARDIEQARQMYAPDALWTAQSLALYTQAVLQGSFVLAKARNGPDVAIDCIAHLRRYVEMLFNRKPA
jgi:TetR/AcrR family transcriptional regulator, transcriptional repressor for nem operon